MSRFFQRAGTFMLNHPLFDIGFFILILYGKHILLYNELYIPDTQFFTEEAKVLTALFLFFVSLYFVLQSSFRRKIGLSVVAFFVSLLLYVDTLYYRYFEDITSFSVLYKYGQLLDVSGTISYLIKWQDAFFFIDFFFLFLMMWIFSSHISKTKKKRKAHTRIMVFMLSTMGVYGSLSFSLIEAGYSGIENRNTNSLASAMMGNTNFHIIESFYFLKERIHQPTLTEKELEEISISFEESTIHEKIENKGVFKGKNVLFVQMESFSYFLLDKQVNQREVTPNLNQLKKEHLSATNFYAQVGDGHTSDAEIVTLTSMYGLSKGSASILYGDNEFNSLPHILREAGYTTFSAHGYRKDFWNRTNLHPSLGFEQSMFESDFSITEEKGFGMTDKAFFQQSVKKMKQLKQPFFSFLITLQHHNPYTGGDTSFDVGEMEGTLMGRYLQSAHEADTAIGVLMEELKSSGLLADTVIILYGDHDGELEKEEYERMGEEISYNDLFLLKKVPFLVISPDGSLHGEIEKPLGHLDILPTTLHLLGVTAKHPTFYGENIFIDNPEKVTRAIYHWYAGDGYIVRQLQGEEVSYVAFDTTTGKELPVTDEMKHTYKQTEKEMKTADKIIRANGIPAIVNYQEEGKERDESEKK